MKAYTIEEALTIGLYWVGQSAMQSDWLAAEARDRGMFGSAANHERHAADARKALDVMRNALREAP